LKWLLKKNVSSHWAELHQRAQMVLMMPYDNVSTTPHLIKGLLDKFKDLFAEPQSLPPLRAIDHQIPQIRGAQPVNVNPYCYSPHQKNEIEKQVYELLQTSIIQLS
jgi:hypothetical protein